jgi:hypothetical protein
MVKAGQLISIESGEYSDYGVHGFFVALANFDPMEERKEWIASKSGQDDAYYPRDEFIAVLLRKGFLLEIEYDRMDLGSYGEAEDFSYNGTHYKHWTQS